MRSTGFTLGVLLASCVLVIIGLTLTLTELNEFKQQPTEKTWQPKPDIETPFETGDDIEGAGASRKRLFAAAPSDAIGVVVMDMQKINATGIFKQGNTGFSLSGTKNLPIEPEELGETVIFAQPGTGGGESVLTGLSTHTADPQALEQALSNAAENTTVVEELNAHRLAQDEFVALKGDDLILFASTPQDLESLIRRQNAGDGRLPSKLQSAIAPYQNSAIHFAATEIGSLKNTMSGKVPVNKVPQGIDQAAGRVDLAGSNMDVEVKVTFLESIKARETADQINTQLKQVLP
ncbi:MAG: hypothetical protein KGZ25_14795, partial [Planctomycetes bacterium]|nr:hypothetical protein [Planctomycetota bacterium]